MVTSTTFALLLLSTAPLTARVNAGRAACKQSANLEIDAQPLASALEEWANETHCSYIMYKQPAPGAQAPAVSGLFTREAGLHRLLVNSGLTYCFANDQDLWIVASDVAINRLTRRCPSTPYADSTAAAGTGADSTAHSRAATEGSTSSDAVADEITVSTNRWMPGIERTADDPQPYAIFDRNLIEGAQVSSTQDFLNVWLPSNSAREPGFAGASSSIDLRGLGSNQTLVLVNGRRQAGASISGVVQQPDLNAIPLTVIEKIEVLPMTASAIYGGGATGGVVNVVLRKDYRGLETRLDYSNSFEGGGMSRKVSILGGEAWNTDDGQLSLQFAANFSDSNPLVIGQRDYAQRARALILTTNPAYYFDSDSPALGATTNVRSAGGENLLLKDGTALGSPITFVPYGYAGPGSDGGAGLLANAGRYNLDLADSAQMPGGARRGLQTAPTTSYVNSVLSYTTGQNRVSLDLTLARNRGYLPANGFLTTATIDAAAPGNPFAQDIRVTTPALNSDSGVTVILPSWHAIAGFERHLFSDLKLGVYYTFSRASYKSNAAREMSSAGLQAISSGALNVLRDTNAYPIDFSAYALDPPRFLPSASTLKVRSVQLSGSMVDLPAGPVQFVAVIEQRRESTNAQTFESGPTESVTPGRSQRVTNGSVELSVPIVSELNAVRGISLLSLQLAGRYEMLNTRGASIIEGVQQSSVNNVDSADPTMGLVYQPFRGVTFRASYGTGFLPPDASQLVRETPVVIPGQIFPYTDPQRGNEPLTGNIAVNSGGSEGLSPEHSKGWSAGVILNSCCTDIRVSLDWTRIEKEDGITSIPVTQEDINNEAFLPDFIRRAPARGGDLFGVGPIVAFNSFQRNTTGERRDTLDLAINAIQRTFNWGDFSFLANGTYLIHSQSQLAPQAPRTESSGLIDGLRWRANTEISWSSRSFRVGWTAHFMSGYWLHPDHGTDLNQGAAKVPSRITHDPFVQWSSSADRGSPWAGLAIQAGIRNVFNRAPQTDMTSLLTGAAFINPLADPMGATYYLWLRKAF